MARISFLLVAVLVLSTTQNSDSELISHFNSWLKSGNAKFEKAEIYSNTDSKGLRATDSISAGEEVIFIPHNLIIFLDDCK